MSDLIVPSFAGVRRHGDLLVLAGQAAVDVTTGAVLADDLAGQLDHTIGRIESLLAGHGASLADVLRVECFLTRREDFTTWNEGFAEAFPEPRPARTTLITELVIPDLLIELQVLAAAPGDGG
jgi:2-iminobutanoate/2-iminopropanoate deaminase